MVQFLSLRGLTVVIFFLFFILFFGKHSKHTQTISHGADRSQGTSGVEIRRTHKETSLFFFFFLDKKETALIYILIACKLILKNCD